ncbi:MAG: MFS transporter, partial [Proteobacteria bacterium]|nr:MFS transporter [Pseudomonadota bacterium]
QFWIICIIQFTVFFCLFTITIHIVPHALDRGLEPKLAASILSVIGSVSILGRIVTGSLIDKIGGKYSLLSCFIILISSLIWLQILVEPWKLFIFAAIYGFAHGSFFTVTSPLIAELFGTESLGQLFGFVLFIGTIGGTLGPTVAGYLFDLTNSYSIPFTMLTWLAFFGLFSVILLLSLKRENRI